MLFSCCVLFFPQETTRGPPFETPQCILFLMVDSVCGYVKGLTAVVSLPSGLCQGNNVEVSDEQHAADEILDETKTM